MQNNNFEVPCSYAPSSSSSLASLQTNRLEEMDDLSNTLSDDLCCFSSKVGTPLSPVTEDFSCQMPALIHETIVAKNATNSAIENPLYQTELSPHYSSLLPKSRRRICKKDVLGDPYAMLIIRAILNSPRKQMTVSDIYTAIEAENKELALLSVNWRGIIRQNLAHRKRLFLGTPLHLGKKRGFLWSVKQNDPYCIKFINHHRMKKEARVIPPPVQAPLVQIPLQWGCPLWNAHIPSNSEFEWANANAFQNEIDNRNMKLYLNESEMESCRAFLNDNFFDSINDPASPDFVNFSVNDTMGLNESLNEDSNKFARNPAFNVKEDIFLPKSVPYQDLERLSTAFYSKKKQVD